MRVLCALWATLLLAACAPDESPPADPRAWSHEQLAAGGRLVSSPFSNRIQVLIVAGGHYQMGYQHGHLLKARLAEFRSSLEQSVIWSMAMKLARSLSPDQPPAKSYVAHAVENALPWVREECAGLERGSEGAVSVEDCVGLQSVLYVLDDMLPRHLPGVPGLLACSQFVARGAASRGGKLVHARNMDWLAIEAIMQNPVVIVRRPSGGALGHAVMSWPGFFVPLTGMNEAGVAVAVNENGCKPEHRRVRGVDPLQILATVLMRARTLDEARAEIERAEHTTCELFVVSHGPSRRAALFENSASRVGVKEIDASDVLLATNHFEFTDARPLQEGYTNLENLDTQSISRLTRLKERLTGKSLPPHAGLAPGAPDYAFGSVDAEVAIDILRDGLDLRPGKGRMSFPCTEYSKGWALGNNHAMQSFVMVPEEGRFWMAAGWDQQCRNAVYSPFVGFDLGELLAGEVRPERLPVLDPPYRSYGAGVYPEPE